MTSLQIITQALQELGAIDLSRQANTFEAAAGLQKLNQLVDLWSTNKRRVWANVINQHTFPSSKQSYTIGPSGTADFNFPRPVQIVWANIVLTNVTPNVFLPVTLLQTKEWLGIPVPGISTSIPVRAYYDQGFVSTPGAAPTLATPGLGTIYFNPYPGAPLPDFQWATPAQITQFADLTTDYQFPPGYAGALVFSLAETWIGLNAPAENLANCRQQAAYWRSQIESPNSKPPRMTSDFGLDGANNTRAGDFNWLTGQPW